MIHFPCLYHPRYHPIPLRIFIDFFQNIAWVFWVNWVFWAFLIYPIYPKNPKYYLVVFSSPFKQPIRITNSISFDYADYSYHLLTLSPSSHGLLRTYSQTFSKVRRNSFPVPFSRRDNCSYSR